jgi:hypothetical protein
MSGASWMHEGLECKIQTFLLEVGDICHSTLDPRLLVGISGQTPSN